jgi:purine-cytosine permease-like protein
VLNQLSEIYVGGLPYVAAGALVASAYKLYKKEETPMESAVFATVSTVFWPVVIPALGGMYIHSAWTGKKQTLSISWESTISTKN